MKNKGMISIEASLLIPMILFITVFIIDAFYIAYVKTSSESKIELAISNSLSQIGLLKNSDFNGMTNCPMCPDAYCKNKLKRTIFDELNTELSCSRIESQAKENLDKAIPSGSKNLKTISISKKNIFFISNFSIKYNFKFNSFLSNFFEQTGLPLNAIQSEKKFKEHRIFDEINNCKNLYDMAKKNKNVQEFIGKFKKAVHSAE